MDEAEVIGLAREAIWLAIEISMPVMLVGLFVGVTVALFQALTQIQEMTLAFVPKIVAIFLAIFVLLPAFSIKMTEFMEMIAGHMVSGGVGS